MGESVRAVTVTPAVVTRDGASTHVSSESESLEPQIGELFPPDSGGGLDDAVGRDVDGVRGDGESIDTDSHMSADWRTTQEQ